MRLVWICPDGKAQLRVPASADTGYMKLDFGEGNSVPWVRAYDSGSHDEQSASYFGVVLCQSASWPPRRPWRVEVMERSRSLMHGWNIMELGPEREGTLLDPLAVLASDRRS